MIMLGSIGGVYILKGGRKGAEVGMALSEGF